MKKEDSGETSKVLIVGIKQKDGSVLYGHAKHLVIPGYEVNKTYALLFSDSKRGLIPIDIWSDEIIVQGEEYIDDGHPLLQRLASLAESEVCEE